MPRPLHVRLDDDTADWFDLIRRYEEISETKLINAAFRVFVRQLDMEYLGKLLQFKAGLLGKNFPGMDAPLEPPEEKPKGKKK